MEGQVFACPGTRTTGFLPCWGPHEPHTGVQIPEPRQGLTTTSALRDTALNVTYVTAPESTTAPGREAD